MSNQLKQKKIALTDLMDDLAPPISEAKVGRIKKAMQQGAKFPPIVAVWKGEKYEVLDGNHRSHAAMDLGRKSINAAVLYTESDAEASLVSELAYALSDAGVPCVKALRAIEVMLRIHTAPRYGAALSNYDCGGL